MALGFGLSVLSQSIPNVRCFFFFYKASAAAAASYSAQNVLVQVAYQALDSITFNCLNQARGVSSHGVDRIYHRCKQLFLQQNPDAVSLGSRPRS